MSKAEILKIVKVIACVIGFGVLGAAIGIPAAIFVISMINDPHAGFAFPVVAVTFMSVFGILGAALGGYVAGYKIIKAKSADLLRKHGGKTAEEVSIHVAAKKGNIEAIKQHIANGADVNEKDDSEWTPLHYAASYGRKEIIELLIANGADVNAKARNEWTPLHHAALRSNKEMAELLIAAGADVNAKSDSGSPPLHNAAINGRKEVAELLIANGADVNAIIVSGRNQGKTPLDMTIRLRRTETADLLRKHGGKTGDWLIADKSIHKAASAGHIEAVKKHLAAGADVNAKDVDGQTPLDMAVGWGETKTADLLRKHGAKRGN